MLKKRKGILEDHLVSAVGYPFKGRQVNDVFESLKGSNVSLSVRCNETKKSNLKTYLFRKAQKSSLINFKCVGCNKCLSNLFWKPHCKRSNVLLIKKNKKYIKDVNKIKKKNKRI